MTLEDFQDMLRRHDWYFQMSDDHNAWVKGSKQDKEIDIAYKELSAQGLEEEARELYNALSPSNFHMKPPKEKS